MCTPWIHHCTEQAGHGKDHFLGKSTSIFYLKGPALAKYTREQRWALVPVDLCVLTCFPVQHFLRSPVLPRFCFAFLYTRSVCVGVGEQLITRALCVYGLIRRAGSTRHCATNPLVSHTRCTSLLAGSRFGVKLASCPQSPPSTSPLSTRHNCVISSQERIFIVLFFRVPRSLVPV